jgi:hypothetical protein
MRCGQRIGAQILLLAILRKCEEEGQDLIDNALLTPPPISLTPPHSQFLLTLHISLFIFVSLYSLSLYSFLLFWFFSLALSRSPSPFLSSFPPHLLVLQLVWQDRMLQGTQTPQTLEQTRQNNKFGNKQIGVKGEAQ